MKKETTIKISKSFKDILAGIGKKGETYEDIIKVRFEDLIEKNRRQK